MSKYNEARKAKYLIKPVCKQFDIGNHITLQSLNIVFVEQKGTLEVETFLLILEDNGIELADHDRIYMNKTLADKDRLNYELAIRELVLLIVP